MYKAVISDLDGTLLCRGHHVTKFTKDVIKEIIEKGINFYIFTFLGLILLNLEAILLTGVIILIFGKLLRTSKIFNRFLKLIFIYQGRRIMGFVFSLLD